ncbi:hypothetical protein C6376_24835 [Streptomyces sp. P3]|uniref:hypothetical protein n=1 Tax=Streptomyces sp. P3 TaxID=2135430 RepID=UPI000D1BA820|nr:hypothetical protein [Streptomyces sp. P3]AVV44185.1 hypothetical protein C6376_24835 [Streptomyces sp. P3]
MAQLVVAGAVFLATAGMRDDHGIGFAGGALAWAPRVLFLVVLAGYLHWLLFTLPAMALARLLAAAPRAALRAALGAAAVTAAHTAWAVSVWDVPVGWTVAWIAGTGLLPVTAAWYEHRRSLGWGAMAARIGAATAVALLLAVVGGFLLEWTRWHAYEPPRLERGRYVGDWIGGGGAYRLRLGENGVAEGDNMPLVDENTGPWDSCSGTGTWTFAPQPEAGRPAHGGARDRITLTIPDCGALRDWQVAGTADQPQLFVVKRDASTSSVITLHGPQPGRHQAHGPGGQDMTGRGPMDLIHPADEEGQSARRHPRSVSLPYRSPATRRAPAGLGFRTARTPGLTKGVETTR